MNCLVSVIIPVYNGESTVAQAIRSILNQSYSNLEIIVINDGSNDNTEDIVRSFTDTRIKFLNLNNNTKKIGAVNLAFSLAKGDFICFQDADDTSSLDKIAKQIKFFSENSHIGACFTGYSINGESKGGNWRTKHDLLYSEFNFLESKSNYNNTVCATVMFRRLLLNELVGYNDYFAGKLGEDFEFCYRLLNQVEACTLPVELYCYNLNVQDSITNSADRNGTKYYDFVFLRELILKRNTGALDPLIFPSFDLVNFELTVAMKAIQELTEQIDTIKYDFKNSKRYKLGSFFLDIFKI